MARKRVTLEQLKPREYEFDVTMPDGEIIAFTMRAPSQAAMWQIELNTPEPIRDKFVNRTNPYHKTDTGQIVPIIDDEAYITAQTERFQTIMYKKILASWVDAESMLKGKTEEEQIAEMAELGSWVISALWKMTQSLVVTTTDAISASKFRGT
jgi:phage-related protein